MRRAQLVLIFDIVYLVLALNIMCCIFVIAAASPVYRPFNYNWDKTTSGGNCGNQVNIFVEMAA